MRQRRRSSLIEAIEPRVSVTEVQLSNHHRYRHTLVLTLVGVIPAWPPELWHRVKRWPHARRRDPARPHVDRTALIGHIRQRTVFASFSSSLIRVRSVTGDAS